MRTSKANNETIRIGQRSLVDSKAIAEHVGFTAQIVPKFDPGLRYLIEFMERETGIEPATFSLGS